MHRLALCLQADLCLCMNVVRQDRPPALPWLILSVYLCTKARYLGLGGRLLVLSLRLGHLLSEELLGVGPYWLGGPLGELEQRWQQVSGELLRRLTGQLGLSALSPHLMGLQLTRVGRWSIDTTVQRLPTLTGTSTVGSGNVVLME